ncbi:dTDP-4-dehydrorhamnose 3,5-epimerase [Terriglobus sp.]|uniref:dTDP-4-dehydrorhamnose 3,5-epimerase n=1 Tax=Terriglobus sp. TaxID=1889013 RepID=UPI003B00D7C7
MPVISRSTDIEGVRLFESPVFPDDRGYFQELYNQAAFRDAGLDISWVQDNISCSRQNVVRGLHYQLGRPQAKLVRVLRGAVIDYAVDLRRSSPTFGKHVAMKLKEGDGRALLVPVGFAHGFVSLEENTVMMYKVSDVHHPAGERTLLWNDPALQIVWPFKANEAILSAKDLAGSPLETAETYP